MVERLYGKVILGRKGKQYLLKTGFGYRNINRNESYKKRMERISDIACKVKSCDWNFEPSWRCDVNTYTKRGNRFVGIMSREKQYWGESQEDFYKRSYIVYFLYKNISQRELKYIDKEMDRNKSYFRGIIIFIEDEQFMKHPKFINIDIKEIYTVLCNAKVWEILKKIQDEDYMKEKIISIFGSEYERLKAYIYEIYYTKNNGIYTYVFPMPFADFAKVDWINYMATSGNYNNVKLKVVCEENCVEYVRKFLDEKVEITCVSMD